MNRKHAVAAGKDRIRSKLQDVKEEKELIISIIENLVAKTNETANSCLEEENQAAFFKNFHQVSQSLESCSEKLFFIRINLLETDEGEEVLQVNRSKESCDEELFKLDASNKATPDMKEQLTTNDATSKNVYSKETLLHLGNKTSVSSDDSYNQVNVVACPASSFYSTLSSSLTNGAFEQNMKFDSYHSAIINDSKRVQEDENQITVGIPLCQKHRTQSYNQKSKQDGHLSNVKDDNSNGLKEMSVKKVVTSTENINDTSNSGNVGLCDEFQSSAQVYHSSFSFGVCDKELAQSTKHSIVKDQLEVDNQSFTSPYKYDKNLESLKCFINVGGQSHMLQTCKKSTNSSPQYATTDSHSCIGDNSQNISQALFSFDIVEEQSHAHTGPDGTERSKPSDPKKQEHLSLFHNRLNQHYFTPSSVCSESSKQQQTDIPEGEQACSLCGSENFLGSSSSLGTPGSWPNASLAADRNLPTPSVPSTACYEQSVHSLASPSSRLKSHPCLPRALDQKPLKLARANERSDFVIRPIRVKTGEPIPVVVSHIVSPSEFWLQPAGTVIEELSHQLQLAGQQYQNNERHPIEIGSYCMAIFPKDYCWYRAVVLDCSLSDEQPNSPNTVTVLYIDYGNKEVVSAAWLRRLNVEFLSVPKQAVQCYLREVKPLFGQWHGSALDQFQKLVLLPFGLRATFYQPVEDNVHPVEISCFVPVLQSYYSIASSLITSGLALRALSEKGNMGTEDHVPVSTAQNAASGFSDMPQHHHFQNRPNLLVSDTSQSSLQNTSDSETDFTPKKNEISRDASAEASGSEDTKQTPLKKKTSCRSVIPEMLLNGDSQSDSTDHSSTGKMFFWNCLVSPAKVQTSEDGFFVALASVVVSPSEFYVHPVTKENSLLDDLREKMAHFYGMKVLKKWPDNSIPLHVGLYFCCRYTLDRYWYRVKLIKVLEKDYYQNTPSTGKRRSSRKLKQPLTPVLVQFIDYGNVEKVYLKDLYPLVEEFRKYPAFVVRCSLAALRPKGIQSMKSEDDVNNALDLQWPEDVGKRMMELMGFKKCLCIQVISTSQTETPRKDTCLNVHVWDTQGSDDILINSVLVEEGLAETDISPISVEDNEKVVPEVVSEKSDIQTPPSSEIHSDMNNWDPMVEDYLSARNSYAVDIDDPGVAVTGYKAKDEQYICKYFSVKGRCPRGENCHFEHVYTGDDGTTRDVEEVANNCPRLKLPAVGSYVALSLSAVFNPGHFYAVFPYGPIPFFKINEKGPTTEEEKETLEALIKAMTEYYSRKVFVQDPSSLPSPGQIVSARSEVHGHWYRARVLTIESEGKNVEVFYLDFGDCEWIPISNIHDLEPRFLYLPVQAVECFQANIEPIGREKGLKWSDAAKKMFSELACNKLLLAHVVNKSEDALYIELKVPLDSGHISVSEALIASALAQYIPKSHLIPKPSAHSGADKPKSVIHVPG